MIGPDGTILRIYQDVNPEDHIEEMLEFLEEASTLAYQEENPPANGITMNSQKGAEGIMNDRRGEPQNDQTDETGRDGFQEATHSPISSGNSPEQSRFRGEITFPSLRSDSHRLQPESTRSVAPSQLEPAQNAVSLVFALGTLGYDFGTEARRDSVMQHMEGADLLDYLDKNPSQAAAIIWTLNLEATPIYAIQPQGAFAGEVYERLRQFLKEQAHEGVERISVPGVIFGQTRLMSGQVVPTIWPELRCMYSWTTAALVEAVCGTPPVESAKSQEKEAYARETAAVTSFLERVYNDLRNLGVISQERAMNYAAANVANGKAVFEAALKKKLELHSIEVISSPICRPGSDCWDVKLLFFDPENVLRAKTVYRFTVDVSDVCPVMVGQVRSWAVP